MNIIVCLKFIRADLICQNHETEDTYVLNPYDLYALESAVEWKSKADCTIICLTMGPKGIQPYLKKLYAMGADQVICLTDTAFAGSDTVATSYILYCYIKERLKYDVILCGEMAVDGETGQVPAGLAARLNIRYVSGVKTVTQFQKEVLIIETGCSEYDSKLAVRIPAVLAVSEFTTKEKSISLFALKKAKQKDFSVITSKDFQVDVSRCGLNGSKTKVLEVKANFVKRESQKLYDDQKKAARLIKELVMKNYGEMFSNG